MTSKSFELDFGPDSVRCSSQRALPFEPKGDLRLQRDAIRSAMGALRVGPDRILHAVWTTLEPGGADAENVLLYNVGAGAFTALLARGVRFERREAAPTGWTHECRWRAASRHGTFDGWEETDVLSEFKDASVGGTLATTWHAVRRSLAPTDRVHSGPFTLRLRVGSPRPLTVGTVKTLVDGVICALHHHDDGGGDREPIARLAAKLAQPTSEIESMLCEPRGAVLGPRRLVHRFRDGIQWNPADDRLVAAELLVESARTLVVSGTVGAAEPR